MAGTIQYYNLTGGLNSIQGIGTINQSPRRTESPDMQNVEYYKLGGLKTMEGNTQFGNTLGEQITLGYEYIYGNNRYLLVCTKSGKVYRYDKTVNKFVLIYTFPTPTDRHSMCSFNNGVVMSNGTDDLVYYKYERHEKLNGTISIEKDSASIVGDSTEFLADLAVGDYIEILGEKYKVSEITDNTHLTLASAITAETEVGVEYFLADIAELNAIYTQTAEAEDAISKPVRGLALQSYQGRIFVGGTDGILYYSEVGLIHGWDVNYGAGAIPTFYDDNSDFTALIPWDKYLIICKRERSYRLNGTSSNDTEWTVEPHSDYTCDSQQSWVIANNSLLIYSRIAGGIYPLLQRTIYDAGYQGAELSVKIKDSLEYINQSKFDYIFPVYHPLKGYIMFYIPLLTDNGSNTCYIFDTRTKTWMMRKVPQNVTMAFRYNNKVYIGTADGQILEEFLGVTFDGDAIEWYWKSPWFSFGQGTNYLSTREVRVKLAEEGSNRFHLRNRRDGKDTFTERTVDINLGAFTGLVWDTGYNEDEINTGYIDTHTVYEVTGNDTTLWTPSEGVEGQVVQANTPLYSDQTCKEMQGYAGVNYKLVPDTTIDPEQSEYTQQVPMTGYAYKTVIPEYKRWTNNNDYLWVDWKLNTSNLKNLIGKPCKVSTAETKKISKYCYNKIQVGKRTIFTPYLPVGNIVQTDGTYGGVMEWTASDTWLVPKYIFGVKGQGNPPNPLGLITIITSDANVWGFQNVYRNPSGDIYTGEAGIGDGDNVNGAIDTTITDIIDNGNGTFDVVTEKVTLRNLSTANSTEGSIEVNLYSRLNTLDNGTILFGNDTFTNELVKANDNTSGLWLSNNENVGITADGSFTYYVTQAVRKEIIVYTYTGTSVEEQIPYIPQLPENMDFDAESLTSTVWDEDSWVVTSHIVKRFPIADQYLNTLQLEFYGNALDEGITLYGFEIDGVQLEEVPW